MPRRGKSCWPVASELDKPSGAVDNKREPQGAYNGSCGRNQIRPGSICVLNWNTSGATLMCVRGLLSQQAPLPSSYQILISDNGSGSEDFVRLCAALPAGIKLQRNEQNLGFAGGHNAAISSAMADGFDYVWLVNNDAEVPDSSTLAALLAQMEMDERCGALSPKLADRSGNCISAAASITGPPGKAPGCRPTSTMTCKKPVPKTVGYPAQQSCCAFPRFAR